MTRHETLKWLPAAFVLVGLFAMAPGAPVAWAGEPLEVSVHSGGDAVTWAPAEAGEFLLRISMPSGKVVERRGSGSLRIDGRAVPGRRWADGVYVWELISMTAGAAGEQRPPQPGASA